MNEILLTSLCCYEFFIFLRFYIYNFFFQVKVQNWVNGTERTTYVGLSARFGLVLPKEASENQKHFVVLADPSNCCSNSSSKVPFGLFLFFFFFC